MVLPKPRDGETNLSFAHVLIFTCEVYREHTAMKESLHIGVTAASNVPTSETATTMKRRIIKIKVLKSAVSQRKCGPPIKSA